MLQGVPPGHTVPTQKHAVTQAGNSSYTYAYDANGNMSSRQGQTISWSSYNYPSSISAGSGSTAEIYLSHTVRLAADGSRVTPEMARLRRPTTSAGLLDIVMSGWCRVDYRHYIYAGDQPIAVYSRKNTRHRTPSATCSPTINPAWLRSRTAVAESWWARASRHSETVAIPPRGLEARAIRT